MVLYYLGKSAITISFNRNRKNNKRDYDGYSTITAYKSLLELE